MAMLDHFTQTNDSVESRLTVVDTVYSDVIRLTNAQSRAAAGRNSIVTQTQRDALAGEIRGTASAILTAINTSYRGMYLFSGGQSTDAAVQPRARRSRPTRATPTSSRSTSAATTPCRSTFDGDAILQGSAPADLFQTLEALATTVQTGNMAGIDQGLVDARPGVRSRHQRADAGRPRAGPAARGSRPASIPSIAPPTPAAPSAEDANLAESISAHDSRPTPAHRAAARRARQRRPAVADGLPQMTAAQGRRRGAGRPASVHALRRLRAPDRGRHRVPERAARLRGRPPLRPALGGELRAAAVPAVDRRAVAVVPRRRPAARARRLSRAAEPERSDAPRRDRRDVARCGSPSSRSPTRACSSTSGRRSSSIRSGCSASSWCPPTACTRCVSRCSRSEVRRRAGLHAQAQRRHRHR